MTVLVALGANLVHPQFGAPKETLEKAVHRIEELGLQVSTCSRWYHSEPVPPSGQPWYVNGVILLKGNGCRPGNILKTLHVIESEFGRIRTEQNAARVLDLDLLAFNNVVTGDAAWPRLPHPRLHLRGFVLLPVRDVAPDWIHPESGLSVDEMISALPEQDLPLLYDPEREKAFLRAE